MLTITGVNGLWHAIHNIKVAYAVSSAWHSWHQRLLQVMP